MEPLPVDRIVAGLPAALADAQADHWLKAAGRHHDHRHRAQGRQPPGAGRRQDRQHHRHLRGAGMIRPNMATMLGFLATDAAVDAALLPELARRLADASFNRVTVDGDTSTNDSFVVIATGQAGNAPVTDLASADGQALLAAMTEVARTLAHAIVRDGEGATKFIAVRVEGGKSTRRMPQGGVCDRAFAAGQDRLLRQRPQPGPHPGRGRLRAGITDLDQGLIELHPR